MWKGDKGAVWSSKQQGTQEAGLEGTLEHFWRELLGAAGISWGTELWGKWVGKKNWKAIGNEQVPHPSTFQERLQERFIFFYKHLLWWMGTSPEYNTGVKTGLTLMSCGLYQNLCLYLSVPSTYTHPRKLPECGGWGFILPRRFCSQLVSSENKTKQNKTKLCLFVHLLETNASWWVPAPDCLVDAHCLIGIFGWVICDRPRVYNGQGILGSEAVYLHFSLTSKSYAPWVSYLTSVPQFPIRNFCFP